MDTLEDHLAIAIYDINQEFRMSAIDRIKAKALQARSIAPTMIKEFEGDLDSLIAEGPKLKAAKDAALSEHTAAFEGLRGEFAGLKSVIDILSNGGPPLEESSGAAPNSAPPPLPSSDPGPSATVDDTGEVIRPKLSV